MKNLKRLGAFCLAFALALTLSIPALAAVEDTGFSDVDADAWYAGAVAYCVENGLMSGTSDTTFAPSATMTRAMLAAVLYRAAGSPAVSGSAGFSDVADDTYYSDAAAWAAESGIISGYGNGLFGSGDPVTREQIATILWRYAGSPASEAGEDFADESAISAYAADAVDWARASGIVNGMDGNLFSPQTSATRAQVATILRNYLSGSQGSSESESTPESNEDTRVLVAYFSATGSTEGIAEYLTDILDADVYEIVPQEPYTSADLNYNDASSRTSQEHSDRTIRPAISGTVDNMDAYDVIFLGYPIWWGDAPNIILTFLESYDLAGKTIVPFCTSASSGIGGSTAELQSLVPDAEWLEGQRFSASASRDTVENWVDGLGLSALPTA